MTSARTSPKVMLRVRDLTKQYGSSGAGAHNVSLDVHEGQILALVGPSGCGKTTLLRAIAGLESPDAGTVNVDGKAVTSPDVFIQPEHRSVGFVFQDYALFPHMTVESNIDYGLPRNAANRSRRVDEMLDLVNLVDQRDRRPYELSGGERQRVALARALAPAPKVLLMDEPFSNLDPNLSDRLRPEVREILHEAGITVVLVTHDQGVALSMGDVIAVMERGRILQVGSPHDAFHSPASRFVAAFLGEADFIPAEPTARSSHVMTELGEADVVGESVNVREGQFDLMVRPEDLTISVDDRGNGRLIEREFVGAFYSYSVELDSGIICRAMGSHVDAIEVGARVNLAIAAGHPLPLFPRESQDSLPAGVVDTA